MSTSDAGALKATTGGRFWPAFVVGLLLMNMVIVGITVRATRVNRDAVAIVPGYDEKALQWDKAKAAAERDRALGWSVTIEAASGAGVVVRLTDRDGAAIEGATGRLEGFHHAAAGQSRSAELRPLGAGRYAADLDASRAGWWTFSLVIDVRGTRWSATATHAVAGESP